MVPNGPGRSMLLWSDGADLHRRFTALPELMFPADRSWLVSSLWDDAWAGVGGSANLISALLADPELRPRAERTDPSIADMWPSALPDFMHAQLKR